MKNVNRWLTFNNLQGSSQGEKHQRKSLEISKVFLHHHKNPGLRHFNRSYAPDLLLLWKAKTCLFDC